MLPQDIPQLSGFDIAAHCTPASAMGGDFYDFIPLGDQRLGVVIGDAVGHGIAAALVNRREQKINRQPQICLLPTNSPGGYHSVMIQLILSVGGAILISAMCSLFEAVLYSVPISYIESLVQANRVSGRILKRLRKDIDRPISAILSLNTVANTAGAAVAGAAAAKVFGSQWLGYFSAFFTLAILMLSEVIPKTAGVVYNRPLATIIARPLQMLVVVFAPMVWLCRFATQLVAKGRREDSVSEDELITMARLGLRTGGIEYNEALVIQNIFALKSKTARDIMTPRTVIFALNHDLTVEAGWKEGGIWPYSRVPVYDEDFEDIVGIVHRRAVLTAVAENRWEAKLTEIMKPVHFVLESMSLDRLLRLFLERRQHLFVVIDEFGGLAGLVTLEDVLEEILGQEIVDEFDQVEDMQQLARRRRREVLAASTVP